METSAAIDLVSLELERCKPWIEAALKYSGGSHDFDDVADNVRKGIMQLWPSERGCIVTEIVVYPKKTYLNVFLAGGELDQILDMDASVKEWAKKHGCTGAMMSGRIGWKKPLADLGWKILQTHFVKELD